MFRRIAHWPGHCALLVLPLLGGCLVLGPDYQRPALAPGDVPTAWTSPAATGDAAAPAAQWWRELSDPVLDDLVDQSFRSNPTLEAAMARLREARAASTRAGAAGLPAVGGSGAAQRGDASRSEGPSNSGWLSLNSSWELDLFGAVARNREGAAAREAARLATLGDARVSLAADVADAYLGYRTCQSELTLAEEDIASREATRKLTEDSVEAGFMAPYESIRSTASVAEARSRLASTRGECQQLENLITRLSGLPRPELSLRLADLPVGLDRLPEPRRFDVAIPAKAVLQRPDVRAAERSLAAASADIGLAEADRYPRVALNGELGYSSSGSGGGYASFGSWSFGPSISLPIFDGGRRKAAVQAARARYDESLADFRTQVRDAIQDVENALTRYAAANERADNARKAAQQYQRYFDAVESRYREGASNLLELEDARRAMLDARQTLLGVQRERLQAWISLNRATGGGAQYEPEPATQTAAAPSTVKP